MKTIIHLVILTICAILIFAAFFMLRVMWNVMTIPASGNGMYFQKTELTK